MRKLALPAFVLALAIPAGADEAKPKCYGEEFVINGKYICAEDPGIRNHTPGTPMPVAKEHTPHLKLAGSLLVNGMMAEQFNQDDYNYTSRTGKYGWPIIDSRTSLERERLGWGLSAQWSADGVWWIEAAWERPERVNIGIDTVRRNGDEAHQTNRHEFTADDITFGVLFDLAGCHDHQYFSVLLGGGIHRRYIRDRYTVSTRNGINNRNDSDVAGITKVAQTRIFGQIDLELYPAGKNRFVGLVLSTRVLSDGREEQNFPTETLNDKEVLLGIMPGFYDVTARVVLRF